MDSIRQALATCQEILPALPAPPAPAAQLPLPTGPLGIVRVRRERTTEDREWYSAQLAVQHSKHWDKVIYERVSYYGSLNPERLAFPSVARVAREVLCSARTVQRTLRRLEERGLIKCLSREGGRGTAKYLVVRQRVTPGVTESHPRGDRESPEVLREGISVSTKSSSFNAGVKSIDPTPIQNEGPKKAVVLTSAFPSQEQKQENAKAPVSKEQVPEAPEPVFKHPQQVALLFKLQRKLGYEANDAQAAIFDGLEHTDKMRIVNKLLGEEQQAAVRGEVAAPPKKPRAPRYAPIHTPVRDESHHCVSEHRWSAPADDGIQNCILCNAERTAERTAEVGAG